MRDSPDYEGGKLLMQIYIYTEDSGSDGDGAYILFIVLIREDLNIYLTICRCN